MKSIIVISIVSIFIVVVLFVGFKYHVDRDLSVDYYNEVLRLCEENPDIYDYAQKLLSDGVLTTKDYVDICIKANEIKKQKVLRKIWKME